MALRLPTLALMLWLVGDALTYATESPVIYGRRWMVTELTKNEGVRPPFAQVWERSPSWFIFEWFMPAFYETENRHVVLTPVGLVTVRHKTLYLLDAMDGHVLWSHALKGRDISDWKVSGATFVYAGADYRDMAHPFLTRAAIDLQAREPLWFHVIDDPQRFVGGRADEWIIALPEGLVLFGDDGMHTEYTGEVVAYELRTGRRKWILRKDYRFNSEIYRTWVATRGRLFVQVADYQEGRLAQAYDQATGSKTEHWHVFGKARVGNSSFPWALRGDGLLVGAYREFAGANAEYPMKVYVDTSWLGEPSLTWKTLVHEGGRDRTGTVGLVGVSEDQAVPILVTLEPNRYLLLNPSTGAVEQEGRLPGSRTWNHRKSVVDRQAALYAYPYLLVGASRALDQREEAYDLIALNLTTGTVEWSFELDSDPDEYSDLTSFAVNGPNVYVSCKNGRILAFRTQAPLLQH